MFFLAIALVFVRKKTAQFKIMAKGCCRQAAADVNKSRAG